MKKYRSGDVFLQLHYLSRRNPYFRPDQILSIIRNGDDPFYWETDEWERRIAGFPEDKKGVK